MAGESIRFNASLSTTGFDSGAARLQQIAAQTSGKVSASFAAMGARIAAVVAPIMSVYAAINAFKGALDMGGRLNDLSKTTGETAGNLAILERAFANAGVGGERLAPALTSLASFVTDLANQMPSAQMAASQLGLSFDDLRGKTPIEQMRILLAAIAGIENPTTRAALAVDVFKKAGRDIVPLARDFSGELANARGELGSLPRILDANAASLDELGDKLGNAVGNKLTELAAGLAAGATGAANLADGLSKIDAAGIGERLGESLRMAFAAPLEVTQALGEFLLAGVLKAGNALNAAIKVAVETYYAMLDNPGFYSGLGKYLEGMFANVGKVFASGIIEAIKAAMSLMDWNPLWRPVTGAIKEQLSELQSGINDAGIAATNQMEQGATQMKAAYNSARVDVKYIYEDTFGAAAHLEKAKDHMAQAKEKADAMKDASKTLADNFGMGANALVSALDALRGFNAKGQLVGGEESPFPSFTRGGGADMTGVTMPKPDTATSGSVKVNGVEETPMSREMRIAEMRGQARQSLAEQRAAELERRGMFATAVQAQMRGERAFERAMTSGQLQEAIAGFAGSGGRAAQNIGEVIRGLGRMAAKDMIPAKEYDRTKSLEENVKRHLLSQAQTSKEKADQASGRGGNRAEERGKQIDPIQRLTDFLTGEFFGEFKERLPQRALT